MKDKVYTEVKKESYKDALNKDDNNSNQETFFGRKKTTRQVQ